MRNKSEDADAPIIIDGRHRALAARLAMTRPENAMSLDCIKRELQNMTVLTTFRAWFHPLEAFKEYNDGDGTGTYLSNNTMSIRGAEELAVRDGGYIDYEIIRTNYDCNIVAHRNGTNTEVELWDPDAFYAIRVLSQGLEGRDELSLGDSYAELIADPKDSFVTIDGQKFDVNDVEQMMIVLKRWLANKR